MKKCFWIIAFLLTACSHSQSIADTATSSKRCFTEAGFHYSVLKHTCVQPFEAADIRIIDDSNKRPPVYVILSEDKQQAEIFAANVPENTLLSAVKGGYLSPDNKIRLTKTATTWKISQ